MCHSDRHCRFLLTARACLTPHVGTVVAASFVLLSSSLAVSALNLRQEIDLSGEWAFEIGDNEAWADRKLDHSRWERITVPGYWENQGFPGYDGFAWYRKRFVVPSRFRGRQLYLKLGQIDDVDVTFFNGQPIGRSGTPPPVYETAYDVDRVYPVPPEFVRYDKDNVIAIRVFDFHLAGGFMADAVGLYSREGNAELSIDLSGKWAFAAGDDSLRAAPQFDHSAWATIVVPSLWEKQGFPNYDGVAWYRREFTIDKTLAQSKLIVLLGAIDDRDRVYFNGALIGQNGGVGRGVPCEACHRRLRAYVLPPSLIAPGRPNVIAVRVYDQGGGGGIYKGPVGVVTRQEYLHYAGSKGASLDFYVPEANTP